MTDQNEYVEELSKLGKEIQEKVGSDQVTFDAWHSGGGIYLLRFGLPRGREILIDREERTWRVGVYDDSGSSLLPKEALLYEGSRPAVVELVAALLKVEWAGVKMIGVLSLNVPFTFRTGLDDRELAEKIVGRIQSRFTMLQQDLAAGLYGQVIGNVELTDVEEA